jgi:four helix bundle protein
MSESKVDQDELKRRTKRFAVRVIRLTQSLPKDKAAEVIGRQLLRCATSVGANYRSACRARSQADFISKMSIVEEEADESLYWMELLVEIKLVRPDLIADLMKEADELLSISVASIKTARSRPK